MTTARENRFKEVISQRRQDFTILLENVFNPHNIAAVMRTCDAVGISEIFVLNTQVPPLKHFGKNSSSSAEKWLTIHQFSHLEDCIHTIKKTYPIIVGTDLNAAAKPYWERKFNQNICIVFGNEGAGISLEMKPYLHENIFIPQVGMIRSLNISVACAIILYEDFRHKSIENKQYLKQLSADKQFELFKTWQEK